MGSAAIGGSTKRNTRVYISIYSNICLGTEDDLCSGGRVTGGAVEIYKCDKVVAYVLGHLA